MGKRIIQQRRGKGSLTYRVKKKAFKIKPKYPIGLDGEWEVISLIASGGHSSPIMKLRNKKGKIFHSLAANLVYEGQTITIGGNKDGDIARLKDIKNGQKIFNIEGKKNDGGKFVRSGGNYGQILAKEGKVVKVWLPSKKEIRLDADCLATIGVSAGAGRLEKPILKAGKKYFIMKTKSKLWPRTSAVKMNAIDHPFGSGRGKRIKSKIAQRNASPGQKVGLLRPRRTGRKKR